MQESLNDTAPKTSDRRLLYGCLAVVALFSVFAIGVAVGIGMQRLTTGDASGASAGNVNSDARTKIESSFDIFWEAMDVVNRDFYGDLPTAQDTTYLAIRGVVDSLGDPHTSFLTPSEAQRFQSNITGNFEGIGARVEWDEKGGSRAHGGAIRKSACLECRSAPR